MEAADGVAAKAAPEEPEFQYVDHWPQGHAREIFGEGLRLVVGMDPNKATLMQCCEIPAWPGVDETQPEECGKRHLTT